MRREAASGGTAAAGTTALRYATVAAILAAGAWGVFVLPWRVPVRADVVSDSAVFGFHNATAILALGVTLLALLAAESCFGRGGAGTAPWVAVGLPARHTPWERTAIVLAAAAGVIVVCGWWAFLPQSYFGESAYFLTRLDMLALGWRPYRDFDYGYGPALLLVPFGAHRLSGGALPLDTAFVASVAAHHVLGILAVAALLARIVAAPGVRIGILALAAVAGLNITLGPIYALLRFVYPAWAAVAFHRPSWPDSWRSRTLAAFLLPFGGFLISPEVGIAGAAAILAGIVLDPGSQSGARAMEVTAVVAAPAAFLAVFGKESLATAAAFGGGAYCFPVLPAPFIVALLGLACFLLPRLGVEAIDRGPGAAATASLAVALGMLLPPALGRCDPGHVIMNGLSLVIVALAAAWTGERPGARRLTTCAATILLLTHLVSQWNQYAPAAAAQAEFRRALRRDATVAAEEDAAVLREIGPFSDAFRWGKRLPFPSDLVYLAGFHRLATPLGAPEQVDRFLKASGRYVPVRHVPPFGGVFDRAAVERVVAESLACDNVLVPEALPLDGRLRSSRAEWGRAQSQWLSGLMVFPVALRPRHDPWIAEFEVVKRLAAVYRPMRRTCGMILLQRRAASDQPRPGR